MFSIRPGCFAFLILSYLLDVESESSAHEHGQFDEQHVPSEVVEGVGQGEGPEGNGGQDVLPRNRQLGSRLKQFFVVEISFNYLNLQKALYDRNYA